MYLQGNEKDQPQLLWEHQRWSLLLSSPNLRRIKVKKGKTRFERGLGEIHLQLFHPNQQSSVQAKAGKQEGSQAGWPVPLNNTGVVVLDHWSTVGLNSYWFSEEQCRWLVWWSWSPCEGLPQLHGAPWMHSCDNWILPLFCKRVQNKLKPSSWGELPPILDAKDYFELGGSLNLPSPVFQTVGCRQKYVAANLRRREQFRGKREMIWPTIVQKKQI